MLRKFLSRSKTYQANKENANLELEENDERRAGITPPYYDLDDQIVNNITKYPKSPENELLIKSALLNNDFLNSLLTGNRLQHVVDCMHSQEIQSNDVIISEGDTGSHLYVSLKGTYEISQKGKVIGTFTDVRVFGELALLYNAKRFATIKSRTIGRIWVLDRIVFKHIMVRTAQEELKEIVQFLKNVPKLENLNRKSLEKVATLFKTEFFKSDTQIVNEGQIGDKFYIIRAGAVTVSQEKNGTIDRLYKGHFFGELALLNSTTRQATVTALAPGTECLTLTGREFIDHFGNLADFFTINYQAEPYKPMQEILEHTDVHLEDLKIVTTLGVGAFGRVELVQHTSRKDLVFALKYMKKYDIAVEKQQEHVYNEKRSHLCCNSAFIVRLYRTYKDKKYLYLLLEPCLGGDLWSLLRRQRARRFYDEDAKFYIACAIQALQYLHERGIIYRDLKTENLLIDSRGYVKLTDFGFAKKLDEGAKTYTFAGTPEYLPPEIILNRGHDKSADYWGLGVLIYELLAGKTPFRNSDPSHMKTYKAILRGVDTAEFHSAISDSAKSIIKKLCKSIPSERLGALNGGIDSIKTHKWFGEFEWELLTQCKMKPPFRPNLKNNVDVHYFDKITKSREEPPDETSGWDEDF